MKYYLYATNALWNVKRFEREINVPDNKSPYEVVTKSLADMIPGNARFNTVLDHKSGDLCILMAVERLDFEATIDRLEYFRLTKTRVEESRQKWEVHILGNDYKDVDSLISYFYTSEDDDVMKEAIKSVSQTLADIKRNDLTVSSFREGTMSLGDMGDASILFEFQSTIDGQCPKTKVFVYEVIPCSEED